MIIVMIIYEIIFDMIFESSAQSMSGLAWSILSRTLTAGAYSCFVSILTYEVPHSHLSGIGLKLCYCY